MGSTFAATLLNSHPEIVCHKEPFHRNWVNTEFPEINTDDVRRERDADPKTFLTELLSRSPAGCVTGLKILSGQGPGIADRLAADNGFRKIVLRRDNLLASFSSNMMAQATGHYHSSAADTRNAEKVAFEPRPFDMFRRWCDAYYRDLEKAIVSSGSAHLDISYDALQDSSCHGQILEFLGCDPRIGLRSDLKPISPARLEDRFSNWPDVCRHMREIGKEDWLAGDQDGAR